MDSSCGSSISWCCYISSCGHFYNDFFCNFDHFSGSTESEESYLLEQEKLRNLLESADRKCADLEMQLKNKLDELETLIAESRRNCASLQEKLTKVESEKMTAIDSYNSEKEAKVAAERLHASLGEEFERVQQDLKSANHRIESLNATYRNSQEYNTSLQQYNSRLQMDCETYKENLERLEQEKSTILEDHATLIQSYPSHFLDMDTELQSVPRLCDSSRLPRKQFMEDHGHVLELEARRLSEL